jgi:hypothetical protein
MMRRSLRLLLVPAAAALLLVINGPWAHKVVGQDDERAHARNRILDHAMDIEAGRVQRLKYERPLSSGVIYAAREATFEMEGHDAADTGADPATRGAASDSIAPPPSFQRTQGCQNVFVRDDLQNVRVNQDCSLRRQAEEAIAINPTAGHNLIVGYNDSRIGFNHGAYAWSLDRGTSWGDQVPPFWQLILKDGHTADAFSDPTATFDANGNAYVGSVLFDINSAASALAVMKSNAGIGGAFYHSPAHVAFQTLLTSPVGLIASDNNPAVAHDKELIVADASPGSSKRNNVYMTWTRFADTGVGVGGDSPIYFSQSTDGGATWSVGIQISGANPAVCTVFQGEALTGACDQDQGSDPIVGSDGTIYVSFNNGNTPTIVNNQLMVKCPPSADCSVPGSWTAPVKIADDVSAQPFGPDPVSGCPPGRQCLPPNGYRLNDYGALTIDSTGTLYFVWSDFRNGGGTCAFGPVISRTSPCNNDVFYAFSTTGGATWSAPINVTPAARFGPTAQWQAWGAVTADGSDLFVGYYDRSYGTCETSGCNDITLARISQPASASRRSSYTRVTTSSMPNLVVANNPVQAGFLGDYMWVAVDAHGNPHVVWADTRGRNGTVDEDVYYAKFGGDHDDRDRR